MKSCMTIKGYYGCLGGNMPMVDKNMYTYSPDKYLDGKELYLRYQGIQNALQKELGYGNLWNYVDKGMSFLIPSSRRSHWQRYNIKIEHYLQERFCMEERIVIKM